MEGVCVCGGGLNGDGGGKRRPSNLGERMEACIAGKPFYGA